MAFAFLMGSAKDGTVPIGSDIDIALYVIGKPSVDLYSKVGKLVDRLAPGVHCDVGILNGKRPEPVYRFEALKGRLLFSKDIDLYYRFFSTTCRWYERQIADYQRQYDYRREAMKDSFNGVIQRKLAAIDYQVSNLETHLKGVSFEDFKSAWVLRSLAERVLQISAEIMIDIAERLIAMNGKGPVATATDALQSLVRLGILKSADPYVIIVRFRNLLVHQYEDIDPKVLYDLSTSHLADFRRFRDEIDSAASPT